MRKFGRVLPVVVAGLVMCLGLSGAAQAGAATNAGTRASAGTAATAATAADNLPGVTSRVMGTWHGANGVTGAVTGSFTPKHFRSNGQQVLAQGPLQLTLKNASGVVVHRITQWAALPVKSGSARATAASGAMAPAAYVPAQVPQVCSILHLVLGPLHLDLLGLVIDLNQVVLNITAVPGAGNLLGNLLCAVAGLLDGGLNLGLIASLLNQILAILQGLGGAVAGAAPASFMTT